jgi:DNA-binding NtrC family response regulator
MTTRSSRVVLIVEHDGLLKLLTAAIIEDAGFAALQASDADEALAILERRSDIALMLTSVAMPGSMDGLGLARTVCKRWPAIKTIIASGQVRLIGSDLTAGSRFFLKPYDAQTMISEIRSLISPEIGFAELVSIQTQKRAVLLRLAAKNGATLTEWMPIPTIIPGPKRHGMR